MATSVDNASLGIVGSVTSYEADFDTSYKRIWQAMVPSHTMKEYAI